MSPAIKCLVLLAVVALLFVTELIPLAITAMGGAIACGLLGFIPAKQVFSGLSNSTVVLFGGMFVVGASMFYTGLAQKIGNTVVSLCGTGENSLMFGLMLVGTVLSSCLSNTGTCACLLPVALGICSAAKIPAAALDEGTASGAGPDRNLCRRPNLVCAETASDECLERIWDSLSDAGQRKGSAGTFSRCGERFRVNGRPVDREKILRPARSRY